MECQNYRLPSDFHPSKIKRTNENCKVSKLPTCKLLRCTKAAQMWFHLLNHNKGLLSCRPWRFRCPWAEAIWLPVPSIHCLNPSRWNGSHIDSSKKSSIKLLARQSCENSMKPSYTGLQVFRSWKFYLICSCQTWSISQWKSFRL